MAIKSMYLFSVVFVMLFIPFFGFIVWWLYHERVREWLRRFDKATDNALYWFLDRVFGTLKK